MRITYNPDVQRQAGDLDEAFKILAKGVSNWRAMYFTLFGCVLGFISTSIAEPWLYRFAWWALVASCGTPPATHVMLY